MVKLDPLNVGHSGWLSLLFGSSGCHSGAELHPGHLLAELPEALSRVGIDRPRDHAIEGLIETFQGFAIDDLGNVAIHTVHAAFAVQLRARRAPHAGRGPLFSGFEWLGGGTLLGVAGVSAGECTMCHYPAVTPGTPVCSRGAAPRVESGHGRGL